MPGASPSVGLFGARPGSIRRHPAVDLRLTGSRCDAANGAMDAEVEVVVLEAQASDQDQTIFLLEDQVTGWQQNAQASPPQCAGRRPPPCAARRGERYQGALEIGSANTGDTLDLPYSGFHLAPG